VVVVPPEFVEEAEFAGLAVHDRDEPMVAVRRTTRSFTNAGSRVKIFSDGPASGWNQIDLPEQK
jgi:hypothetical protein